MIVVTGATGHLGRLVVDELLKKVPASRIVAAVRDPEKAADLRSRGVVVRQADYDEPETLASAFAGAARVLLVSGSEVGRRLPQHRAVIEAAKAAGATQIVYTSSLHADTNTIELAKEHKATEEMIFASGLPYTILRNGWYLENYTDHLDAALEHGAIAGSSGSGRVAAAARADYAAAAATVLTESGHEKRIYELAGDTAFTMEELAAEVSRQLGRTIVYRDLTFEEHTAMLVGAGLPKPLAEVYADSDQGVKRGELNDDSGDLRRLIGRPTTPMSSAVKAALRKP